MKKLSSSILICSPASEVSALDLNGKDLRQLDLPKTNLSQPPCSGSIGPKSPTSETYGMSQRSGATCSREVSRASRFRAPAENSEKTTIATSGRQCSQLLTASGRLGFLLKTLLTSRIWFCRDARMTWRVSAISPSRSIFRLALLDYLPWNGTSGLLPRFLAMSWKGTPRRSFRGQPGLQSGTRAVQAMRACRESPIYPNPRFIEAVKGYPDMWTELGASEIPSPCKSSKSLREQ